MATLPGMAERTVAVNSLSKTYSVTGWRVGWVDRVGAADERDPQGPRLPDRGRGRAAPGGRRRGARPARRLLRDASPPTTARRRDLLLPALEAAGLRPFVARRRLLRHGRHHRRHRRGRRHLRAPADGRPAWHRCPGSSFYSRPELGRTKVRFAFPKREETLAEAARRLRRVARWRREDRGRDCRRRDRRCARCTGDPASAGVGRRCCWSTAWASTPVGTTTSPAR